MGTAADLLLSIVITSSFLIFYSYLNDSIGSFSDAFFAG